MTPTGVFDRAKRVYVGKSPTGAVACYFREEGDSHRLDIGIAAPGAFVRLATPEPREATPTPPVRIFAGKEKTRRVGGNEFTTGEYTILKAYDGPVAFSVPEPKKGGFTAVGKADAKRFLEMVAAAKGEFVVVQSERGAKAANIVAVYRFDATMVPVLVSCAEKQGIATVEAAPAPVQVQSAASPENWTVYENARYGTTVEYPAGIFSAPEPPSENGDGRVFHSADGRARLTIYASHNLDGDSPQNYLNKYIGRDGLSFRRVTAAFFAISGTRDGDIFYQRCNFSKAPNDVIHCLAVSYPADQKTRWDATVDRMSRSLRAGQGIEAR
ncbi:MAG: hypothetical protein GC182_17555 [Rhodopseudomonas sp.]|nr:hypothetical protein [Rhodopseudomonas sp.]